MFSTMHLLCQACGLHEDKRMHQQGIRCAGLTGDEMRLVRCTHSTSKLGLDGTTGGYDKGRILSLMTFTRPTRVLRRVYAITY